MEEYVLIGLTGSCCAGKNYVAALLEKRGFPVLDVDKLGHEALARERDAVTARFGADVARDGGIDRKRLGEKVFGKPAELAALEAIVHPAANALTDEWIAARGKTCVINAALLHKSSAFSRLDAVIIVKACFFVRLVRAKKRDKLALREIIARFASQRNFPRYYSAQYLNKYADKRKVSVYIVNNTRGNPEKQIDGLLPFLNTKKDL
jgi:dephospho-CoA kinase